MKRKLLFLCCVLLLSCFSFGQDMQYNLSLDNNGSTSGNSRAPQGVQRYARTVYLITATEMAASGFTNGDAINAIGFYYSTAQDVATTGSFKVLLQNTTDTSNLKSTTWSTAITGMTTVSNSTITIPAATGQVNHVFAGGSTFNWTGGGIYIAFEYDNPSGTIATTANVALCTTTLTGGLKSAQSTTAAPTTIAASNWRPMTYLGKNVPCAAVSGLSQTAYTDNSSTITWSTPLNAQLEWGVHPYTQGSGGSTATVTNASTYTIPGLALGKSYDVYLRKNCGSGVYSEWRTVTVGTSNTTPVSSFPYSMNFEPSTDQAFLYNLGWGNQSTGNIGTWGWYADDLTDGNTANDYSQSPAYFIGSALSTTAAQNAWMFSRPLSLVAGNIYNISYYYRTFSSAATTGAMNFTIAINSTASATGATTLATHADYNNLNYMQETVSFSPPTTGTYYLGFQNNTPARTAATTGNYIFIDTVSISTQLGTSETNDKENLFTIYPNPVSDVLNIKTKGKVKSVVIYDLSGRRVNSELINNSINISSLQSGTYVIDIETSLGKSSQKFIKK